MPRLSNSLPKYRKHRATGQAVVTLCGRDIYLGPHGTQSSRQEYDRVTGEWLAAGRQPLHIAPEQISVAELSVRYLKYARAYYVKNGQPTSEMSIVKAALSFVRREYSRQPADEFGPLALKAVRNKMIGAGLALTTINKYIARIQRMFRWALAEQLVRPDVYQGLVAVSGLRKGRGEARETEAVLPLEDDVMNATLPHLPEVVADMIRIQRITGMREGELFIMRPCDIDRSVDPWCYIPESHKCEHHGSKRRVCLGPQVQKILLRYLARDPESYCFRPCDSESKRRASVHAARITPSSCGDRPGTNRRRKPKRAPGERYNDDSYRRSIQRACDAAFPPPGELAKRPDETINGWLGRLMESQMAELRQWQAQHRWSPNQLRHSAATEIRRRYGLETAATVLGHSNPKTTEIYAERDYAQAANVARQVG